MHQRVTKLAFLVALIFVTKSVHSQEATQTELSEKMQALLWVQTSLEYPAATRQAYQLAATKLKQALANPRWSAAPEQGTDYENKPPAVILDVDETVLDNSPFNARLVNERQAYVPEKWNQWCGEMRAKPIEGAKEFIQLAKDKGVKIYFVTNRDHALKKVTHQNLNQALGMTVPAEQLLLKNERPEWTSAKTHRRGFIAKSHRILLLIGDDVNDFVSLGQRTPQQRRSLAEHFSASWGHHWILLPNPIYGSWEKSIYEYNFDRTASEKQKLLLKHLRSK